jgi:hypothetical protein
MSAPGKCPDCHAPVYRRVFRSYCRVCNRALEEDRRSKFFQIVVLFAAFIVLTSWGRLATNKILPSEPSAGELFVLYIEIFAVVTVVQYIVVYLYMRFFGTYE